MDPGRGDLDDLHAMLTTRHRPDLSPQAPLDSMVRAMTSTKTLIFSEPCRLGGHRICRVPEAQEAVQHRAERAIGELAAHREGRRVEQAEPPLGKADQRVPSCWLRPRPVAGIRVARH